MDEFVSLLKALKKNDKIAQNVLVMMAEGAGEENELGEAVLRQCRGSFNKEPILDFLFILCTKEPRYLSFFRMHRGELGAGDHRLDGLLGGGARETRAPRDGKRIKVERRRGEGSVFEEALSRNSGARDEGGAGMLTNAGLRVAVNPAVLYLPNQCKLCGLRFGSDDEGMGVHIDEHRRRTRALGEKDCISREFFPTLDAWTRSIEKVKLNLKVDRVEKIVHSGGSAMCDVCHSKIDVEWDDDEDNWVLRDAVLLEKAGETTFCHRRCVS